MKGLLAGAVLLAVAAGAASTTATPDVPAAPVVTDTAAGPQPGVTGSDPGRDELDSDGLPPRIDYPGELFHYCDEQGRAFGVEPDVPDAWTAAERGCLRMQIAAGRAPWPGGMRP